MNTAKELLQRAWTIVHEAQVAWDEALKRSGGPTEADKAAMDRALDEAETLESEAQRIDRLDGIDRRFREPVFRPTPHGGTREAGPGGADFSGVPHETREMLRGYASQGPVQERHVSLSFDETYRRAFRTYIRRGNDELGPDERRALSEGVDTEGGFLVPVDMDPVVIRDPREPSVVRELATVGQTVRDVVSVPTVDRIAMAWTGEGGAITEQNTDFGQVEIHIGKLAGLTKITRELLEDAAADVTRIIQEIYQEAAAFEEEKGFLTGDGVNKPVGILFGNRVTRVNTATNDTFAADDTIEIFYKLPPRYRRNGTWLMDSQIEKQVRKFKGSDNNYLWQPGLQADRPPTLLGRPIRNPDSGIMDDSVADGKEIVLFGDFRNYHVRDRIGTTLQRLEELYAANDQVGFIVRRRVGGNVGVAEALRVLKVA